MTETVLVEPAIVILENKSEPANNQSDTIILDSLDESLASLGESVKHAVYSQLQKTYHIERHEIPSKIEAFALAIEEIFGDGARLVEMRIMEKLHSKAKGFLYIPIEEEVKFKDYVQTVRSFLENSVTS